MAALADDVLAWELGPDGWRKVETTVGVDSQSLLETLAEERVRSAYGMGIRRHRYSFR